MNKQLLILKLFGLNLGISVKYLKFDQMGQGLLSVVFLLAKNLPLKWIKDIPPVVACFTHAKNKISIIKEFTLCKIKVKAAIENLDVTHYEEVLKRIHS